MFNVQIVSWLLTRRCNLKCDYCGLIRTPPSISNYPSMEYYYKNEADTNFVVESLKRLHKHNPNIFVILYGGEPLVREDLPEIVEECNSLGINYTIISNSTPQLNRKIERLLNCKGGVKGFTASIDPSLYIDRYVKDDSTWKSVAGSSQLINLKGRVKDLVAEITATSKTIHKLPFLIETMTDLGISSDVTMVDSKKTPFYDFSNIEVEEDLVYQTPDVGKVFDELSNPKYNIHMQNTLLPEIWNILPSNLDCEIEKNVHNLTIDADGYPRLCLRIRGKVTPTNHILNYMDKDGTFGVALHNRLILDKQLLCKGCNWTCMLMSKLLASNSAKLEDLTHKGEDDG